MQSAGEQLVVGTVNRIAALECHDIFAIRQASPHVCRGLAGEHALRQFQSLQASTEVEALSSIEIIRTAGCSREVVP